MKQLFVVFVSLMLFSCKNEAKPVLKNDTAVTPQIGETSKSNDTIAYFENALVYQYKQNNVKEELWIYVNEQKNELLFVPNDDMIQAVISYPDGMYRIFGTNEKGEKVLLKQFISSIVEEVYKDEVVEKVNQTKIISQNNIQQKDILCQGYYMKYLKMEGGETLFATTQIPINSFQIYGFSRLEGDCKLPINMDYSNVFQKNQLITHVERDNFRLELLNYSPNPYELNIKDYQ